MNKRYPSNSGFSLVELTVVLLIITLLASVAVRETSELAFQTRYEQTKERLEMIKQAILGNPRQIINGQQAVSGFVADMGRLPTSLRELIQRSGDCSDDAGDVSEAECLGLATPGVWTASAWNSNSVSAVHPSTGLRYGWNGPYLNVSGSASDVDAFPDGWGRLGQGYCSQIDYTDQTSCETNGAVWMGETQDFNNGWYFDSWTYPNDQLIIESYGKDQVFGGSDYDADFPPITVGQPIEPEIKSGDWQVDISGGISASFVKTTRSLPISYCSDPSRPTKATCAPETWYGLCDKAGFYNADSCSAVGGNWGYCSDGTSATQSTCSTAGGTWSYCSDRSSINQAACIATTPPGIWETKGYGCSDQTYVTKDTCEINGKTWYGCADGTGVALASCGTAWFVSTSETSILPTMKTPICMKVFYRTTNSTIGTLVSDGDKSNDADGNVKFDPNIIIADGNIQAIRFTNFRDSESSVASLPIPLKIAVGSNAIGIYQYNGTSCKTSILLYPNDRQTPIQVDFHPRTTLPVIHW